MSTVKDIIKSSLRLLGVIASGEEPTPEELSDALEGFNLMLDSWSTENLSIYSTQDQVFTWPAGEITQTLGPSGDFVGNRPVELLDSTYFKDNDNGISFNIKIINQSQYDDIALKTVTATYPNYIWLNMDMDNIGMYLFPVPTKNLEFHFISAFELKKANGYTDELHFPPGYLRAFKYCLACELAPEFGVEPAATISRIAMVAKRNIKRINQDDSKMTFPSNLIGKSRRFNIYAGE